MFAHVVDPETPLLFEDFHSDDEGGETEAEEGMGVGDAVYGPSLPGEGAGGGGGVGVGGGGMEAKVRNGGTRRWKKQLTVEDPDKIMISSESESGSEEEDEDEDEGEDDGCGAAQARSVSGALAISSGDGVGVEIDDTTDDEESDDGLVAYDMDDDESEEERWGDGGEGEGDEEGDGGSLRIGEGRVPLPTTLRGCLTGLRSSNADEVEAAVFALPELAARCTDLSGEICADATMALLRLEDRIAMHDFVGRRHRGLVALSCADPSQVALRLSQAVW